MIQFVKVLSLRYFDEPMITFAEVVEKKRYKTFAQVPLVKAAVYGAHDSLQTYKLKFILEKELKKEKKLRRIFYKMELPLADVLFDMERTGIKMDPDIIKNIGTSVKRSLKTIEDKILEAIKAKGKKEINLNSPKQVEKLLFDDLKLPVVKKSPEGRRSTAADVLEELSELHPIPGLIIKYRDLFKLFVDLNHCKLNNFCRSSLHRCIHRYPARSLINHFVLFMQVWHIAPAAKQCFNIPLLFCILNNLFHPFGNPKSAKYSCIFEVWNANSFCF